MAQIVVIGSVARDEVIRLRQRLREGTHLDGSWQGGRLGGGASCTAVPLAHAGHHVSVVGAVGTDELGRELLAEIAATGVDTSQLIAIDQETTRSLVMVDQWGERTVVNLVRTHEERPPVRLLEIDADCVYVRSRRSDLAALLREKATGSLIVSHVPPETEGSRPAHVLVASASDVGPEVLDDPLAAGRRVAGDLLQWMVLTRGAEGATAFGADEVLHVPARKVVPVDTTGAGDSFAAGLLHALVSGAPMASALATAVNWGAEATLWDSSILPADAVAALLR